LLKHYQFHHDNKYHEQRQAMMSIDEINYLKKIDFF
jgi:hypothetical protein